MSDIFLCTPETPMPKDAPGRWSHTTVETLDSSSDYTEKYKCKDCGVTWTVELAE